MHIPNSKLYYIQQSWDTLIYLARHKYHHHHKYFETKI